MKDLTDLRKIAENATPGPWEVDGPANAGPDDTLVLHNNDGGAIAYVQPLWDDATHIATFDPPTVLALIDRLEQAEAAVARVRGVHKPVPYRVGSRNTGIPEFVCEACHAANWGAVEHPCPTISALDGDQS